MSFAATGTIGHSGAAERADGGRGGTGHGHGQQGAPAKTAPGGRIAVGSGVGPFGAGRVVGDVESQWHDAFLSRRSREEEAHGGRAQ